MKLDPGFPDHWKTQMLIERLGSDGVIAVLRLWGNAQIRRQFSGLELTPRRLALETKWRGNAEELFSALTDPDAPWLDPEEGGTWAIHGFSDHQSQVVALWENGRRGGRPRKVSPTPPSKEEIHPLPLPLPPLGFETKPNGFESKPNGFSVEAATARLLERINAMRDGWKLPLSSKERAAFEANLETLLAITDEQWQTLNAYMRAKLPEGSASWQPRLRSKFIETIGEVFQHAEGWRNKKAVVAMPKPAPAPEPTPEDQSAIAEFLGNRKAQ